MDLYSIRNQRISPPQNRKILLALFSLRSCVALLARGAAYRKKKVFGRKQKSIPFCEQEPILDPSRVFHSLAWCKRLLTGPFSSPSRIRCGRVLVTLLVAATSSHLNAASSSFLL